MGRRLLHRLKSVDFYRKIPNDLTEATLAGAVISLSAAAIIFLLLSMEFAAFLRPIPRAEMVVDRSPQGETLAIFFNLSFPNLSCEYATLDVSDVLGQSRLNLTRAIRKRPIDSELVFAGTETDEAARHGQIEYDDLSAEHDGTDYAKTLDAASLSHSLTRYDVVVVNFFAPWCSWCQRLAPTWELAARAAQEKYPEADGRVRFAKVDCVAQADLCRQHVITAFPSIRIFRHGSDDVLTRGGRHEHEAYYGARTKEALLSLADALVQSAGLPHNAPRPKLADVAKVVHAEGCNFAGVVRVKKVPGTMHFAARAPGLSVDYLNMNMSHVVHHLTFGPPASDRALATLAQLRSKAPRAPPGAAPGRGRRVPRGAAAEAWGDRLAGRTFAELAIGETYEHYLQVVRSTLHPRGGEDADAYEYTVQSHAYEAEAHSSAKFSYSPSPIQIIVHEERRPLYAFFVAMCAVLGGVLTLAGIVDGLVHHVHSIQRKMEIGKQG